MGRDPTRSVMLRSSTKWVFKGNRALGGQATRVVLGGEVLWASDRLSQQLATEDLQDDYEVGIPANVRRAARRALQEAVDSFEGQTEAVRSTGARRGRKYTVMEVFSPSRVTARCQQEGIQVTSVPSWDLAEGWDYFQTRDRARLWQHLRTECPDLVILTPECKAFSQMMNVNWERMSSEDVIRIREQGMAMLHGSVQIAEYQLTQGRHFLLEHPEGASSWHTEAM